MAGSGRPGEYYCCGHGKWHWQKDEPQVRKQGNRKFCLRGWQITQAKIAEARRNQK